MELQIKDLLGGEKVATVTPRTSLQELHRVFRERSVAGLPVVNEAGSVVGVVTWKDLDLTGGQDDRDGLDYYRDVASDRRDETPPPSEEILTREVWEIMQTRLYSVGADDTVAAAARTLRRHGLHRVLVIAGKKLIGVLTAFDLIGLLEDPDRFHDTSERDRSRDLSQRIQCSSTSAG